MASDGECLASVLAVRRSRRPFKVTLILKVKDSRERGSGGEDIYRGMARGAEGQREQPVREPKPFGMHAEFSKQSRGGKDKNQIRAKVRGGDGGWKGKGAFALL